MTANTVSTASAISATEIKGPDEYQRLRTMIIRGEILPNERIIEAEYSDKLNTNRANIRRALARLEQEGLVVIEPFRGARVRLVTPEEAIEIFQVRAVLEVLIAEQAATRACNEDMALLDEQMLKVRDALSQNDPVAVGMRARKVREELWRISGNGTAARILSTLHSQLVRIWYQSVMMPGRAESVILNMQKIVDALRCNDARQAALAMRDYHDGAVSSLTKALRRQDHGKLHD